MHNLPPVGISLDETAAESAAESSEAAATSGDAAESSGDAAAATSVYERFLDVLRK